MKYLKIYGDSEWFKVFWEYLHAYQHFELVYNSTELNGLSENLIIRHGAFDCMENTSKLLVQHLLDNLDLCEYDYDEV